jgi:8-oxo-dGTP diphosphatase
MPGIFHVAAEAIIEKEGKILITKRSEKRDHAPGEWETLTGRVENGESFQDAVKREVKEEVSLEVEIVQPYDTFHFYRGAERVEHLGVSFWCKYKSGEVVLDTNEQSDYKWVTTEEALSIITDENIRSSIQKFKKVAGI